MERWLMRVPADLAEKVDARVAKSTAKSRNEWLVRVLEWSLARDGEIIETTTTTRKIRL